MDIVREPARDVPVVARPDVLVVGGGAAGIAAATAAARRGADTMLVEGSGFLGGLASLGLINLLLTMDDGAGTQVVAGICQEVVDRLEAGGHARFPSAEEWNRDDPALVDHWRRWGLVWGAPPEAVRYSVAFDPEAFIDVAHDLLGQGQVRLRLHTWFADVLLDGGGRIDAVLVESKAGREAICPSVVVDATGDGDVFVAAGAEHERVATPAHLWFRVGGVDMDEAEREPGLWFRTTGAGRVLVPWGPGEGRVDACDPDQVTEALVTGRVSGRAAFESLRAGAPGFADSWLDDHARLLGVTESRRLVGHHVLTKEEGDVRFADSVAQTGHWTRRKVVYDVPYRCLRTPVSSNLLVAGRCISTTRYVHQATKEIPAAMATGEAAGVAAALAAPGGDVHAVDVDALRADLRAGGAIIGGDGVGR
ncbi:MAG TPA: FAD-dependent oxidoreductase [Acidimicrobiales bacterium]|nr:FAD-dependent oxidoreductase [Acidimicrobiales bacterium]